MGTSPPLLAERPGSPQANNEEGGRHLLALVQERLCRTAHRLLHPRLRPLFDPEDVAQDVWCALCAKGIPVSAFATEDKPAAYLLGMARHRTRQLNRRFLDFSSRDVRRKVCVAAATSCLDPEPCPELVAEHADTWSHFIMGLSPEERGVLLHLCNRDSIETMLRSMGLSERTVRTIRQRLLTALRELAMEMEAAPLTVEV